MELECSISTDGALLECNPEGMIATSFSDEDRVSRFPHAAAIAQAVLFAYEEPGRMMEYVPGPRAGVFRVTWKPIMEVAGMTMETDIALLSVRDCHNGRLIMCTLDSFAWFELLEWSKSTAALDPTPVPDGLGLSILQSLSSRGGGGMGIKAATLYKDVRASSKDVLLELDVLAEQGFIEVVNQSPPTYRLTRRGAEALMSVDE